MILAQYTIRSKQDYIFKTNRVLEIVGASEHIAGVWEELFGAADGCLLKYRRSDTDFSIENVETEFKAGKLDFSRAACILKAS